MTDIQKIKQNPVCLEYKKEMLDNPQLWVDLLKYSSQKAMDYLNFCSENEILTLIQQSAKSTYITNTLFTEWLSSFVDFIKPLDPNVITQDDMAKMVRKCKIHAAGTAKGYPSEMAYTFPTYYHEQTNENIFTYNESTKEFEPKAYYFPLYSEYNVKFSTYLYLEQKIVQSSLEHTNTFFVRAYQSESTIAKEMKDKCVSVLQNAKKGFLDPEFQRTVNKSIRNVILKLAQLKQYDLLLEIFTTLSPPIAREAMTAGGKECVFRILTAALPLTRHDFGKMIDHACSDGKASELKNKLYADTLVILEEHYQSVYSKITDTPKTSSSSSNMPAKNNGTMIELTPIEVYEKKITASDADVSQFFDGMDLDEILAIGKVIPDVIEHDLMTNPSKWSLIAKRNEALAYQYITAFNGNQAATFVSKAPTATLIALMNMTINANAYFSQTNELYLKTFEHYKNSPNGLHKNVISLLKRPLKEQSIHVIEKIATNILALNDNSFYIFINQHTDQLEKIFLLSDNDPIRNRILERTLKHIELTSWKELPKGDSGRLTTYLLTNDNSATILSFMKFDLTTALLEDNLFILAQQLYMKHPTEKALSQLIGWVEKQTTPGASIETLGINNEIMDVIPVYRLKHINPLEFYMKVKSNALNATTYLHSQNDAYLEKLIHLIAQHEDKYLLEKIIIAFGTHTPLKFLQKIDPKCVLSFAHTHLKATDTPYIEKLFNDLLTAKQFDKMIELVKHTSNTDLWHLHYSIFSQKQFIISAVKNDVHLLFFTTLNACANAAGKDISSLYIDNTIQAYFTGNEIPALGFGDFMKNIPPEFVCTIGNTVRVNMLVDVNNLERAKILYLANPAYFDKHAHKSTIKLKAIFPDLDTVAQPLEKPISEVDKLRAENAALKLENAALKKQMGEMRSGQGVPVLMSAPEFVNKPKDKTVPSSSNKTAV